MEPSDWLTLGQSIICITTKSFGAKIAISKRMSEKWLTGGDMADICWSQHKVEDALAMVAENDMTIGEKSPGGHFRCYIWRNCPLCVNDRAIWITISRVQASLQAGQGGSVFEGANHQPKDPHVSANIHPL